MAVYKVPQDVEAEDKLLGPFSFRQFIYLIVAALAGFMAFLFSKIFIGLIVIPLPIVLIFLVLAFPFRKDQPTETYIIAMLKFFFKPRKRLWDPEGTISLVQITAPRAAEGPQLKEFGGSEASQRLAYLAQVVDTQGWATRGAMSPNDSLNDIVVAEANQAEDILDDSSGVARAFDQRIAQADDARLQAARQQMTQSLTQPAQAQPPQPQPEPQQDWYAQQPQPAESPEVPELPQTLDYNPYPSSMRQHVINPVSDHPEPVQRPPQQTPQQAPQAQAQNTPSSEPVSPDIIRLANNNDLSISAIAREANRLNNSDEEVVVSLR